MKNKRRTETTIETHEIWIARTPKGTVQQVVARVEEMASAPAHHKASTNSAWCDECGEEVRRLTAEEAAMLDKRSSGGTPSRLLAESHLEVLARSGRATIEDDNHRYGSPRKAKK